MLRKIQILRPRTEEIEKVDTVAEGVRIKLDLAPVDAAHELVSQTQNARLIIKPEKPSRQWPGLRLFIRRNWLFLAMVVLPTLVVSTYYLAIASDLYASQASYVIRQGGGGAAGGLGAMMGVSSLSRADDDSYAVSEYLTSRDAIGDLDRDLMLRTVFSNPAADFLSRFPGVFGKDTDEALYSHFQDFISVDFSTTSGISTIQVKSFNGEDAHRILVYLLGKAEALINRLNGRAEEDSIRFASEVVAKAEERVLDAQKQMTDFRNVRGTLDPNSQSTAILDLTNQLSVQLTQAETALAQITTNSPDSPLLPQYRNRIAALRAQIVEQTSAIAGNDQSLAPAIASYERLALQREMAVKSLTSALVSLESSRQDATTKRLYLETIAEPSLPDEATYPARFMNIAMFFGLSLLIFFIARSLRDFVWEHAG